MVREAVAENLEVIRGMPPRAIRPSHRLLRLWVRRAPLFLVPLTLAGSTYVISNSVERSAPAPVVVAPVVSSIAPLHRTGLREQPQPTEVALSAAPVERVRAAAFPLAVRRVVLDSGHGGTDPGAAAGDVVEKNLTLDIGRRLKLLLEGNGFDVVATREADDTIALKDRARMANDSKSDIFVSIHVNSLVKHRESRGIETYYLGATSDPTLTELAAAENRVSGYSIADMRKLLDGIYADARRDESRELAAAVQKQLFSELRGSDTGLENWGVKRAPFIVLVATDMPAILAEVGCISNPREAAMLQRPEYRQKIAEALFEGIRAYAGASDAPREKGIGKNG
jgi:N-acetylmuramoyl-L-alanine amidase